MFLDRVTDSVAYDIFNQVAAKSARGETVHSLAIGEPSFATPPEIIKAAHEAMKRGETHYGPSYGTPEVREAVMDKVRKQNKIGAEFENTIFVTTKFAVFASLCATSRDGSEVLIPDPGYYYAEPALLCGARPVRYRLSRDFGLDLDEIGRKIGPRTSALVLNTPSNPPGRVIPREQLEDLLELCRKRSVKIISDESYEDLVYEGKHVSIGSLEPGPDTVVSLFSLSKSYAMTGWRAGYMIASSERVKLVNRLMENTLTCFPAFIQSASAFALRKCRARTLAFRAELRRRRRIIEGLMDEIPSLSYQQAQGAFYSFPKYRQRIPSTVLAKRLLAEKNVAVIPGSAFGPGGEHRLRLSFAAPEETITAAMEALGQFMKRV